MRQLSILLLFCLCQQSFADISGFSDRALLVKEVEGKQIKSTFIGYLKKEAGSQRLVSEYMGHMNGGFIGLCLNVNQSPCVLETNYKDLYDKAFKNSTGKANPDMSKFPVIPPFAVQVTTTLNSVSESRLEITVNAPSKTYKYVIEKVSPLSDVQLDLATLTEDKSDRKDVTEVDANLKSYAYSVIQIEKETDGNNVLHDSAGSGTGFFISTDGLLLTNHHVASMYPECVDKLYCDIQLNQIAPDNSRKTIVAKAFLLAKSVQHDFVLLKINVPSDLKIKPLPIDLKSSGEDLITFGYAGDRFDPKTYEKKLTYSFGKLIGFNSLGFLSSNYIAGGASGSPILNTKNMALTGIMSNGAGSTNTGEGDPGIFRPISLIESEYGITSYLNRTKQSKIKQALKKLTKSQDPKEAKAILEAIKAEKTYYGLPYLKDQMISHPSKQVRKAILTALEEISAVAGK